MKGSIDMPTGENLRRAAIGLCAAILWSGVAAADSLSSSLSSPEVAGTEVAAKRLGDNLSREMLANFNLFIYINKAGSGPLAQRMYVFAKNDKGELSMLYDWPVSTGRDSIEPDANGHLQSTVTPRGFFELDAARFYEEHTSGQWNEPMPYAMFFNWKPNGHDTGLAIHGTTDENVSELGKPASAGCVRLSLENARTLFDLIRTEFRSPDTPQLAYLDGNSNVSSEGLLLHDQQGQLQLADGYSVVVAIDDYGGQSTVASAF